MLISRIAITQYQAWNVNLEPSIVSEHRVRLNMEKRQQERNTVLPVMSNDYWSSVADHRDEFAEPQPPPALKFSAHAPLDIRCRGIVGIYALVSGNDRSARENGASNSRVSIWAPAGDSILCDAEVGEIACSPR
jgi:hypothetical protein